MTVAFVEKIEVVTKGLQGVKGDAGVGIAAGGTAGQVLAKVDGTDYNTEWVEQVSSTNLSIGVVSPTTVTVNSDTGTDATLPAAVANVTAGVMTAADKAKLDGVEAGATADQTGAEIVTAIDTQLGGSGWQTGTTNLSVGTVTTTTVAVNSDTGTDATLPAAVANTSAGVMTAADKAKLDGVEAGATADQTGAEIVTAIDTQLGGSGWQTGTTNLSVGTVTTTTVTVNSDTGTDATLPAAVANTSAGVMTAADKAKLDGVEAGATAYSWTLSFVQSGDLTSGLIWMADATSGNVTRNLPITPTQGMRVRVKNNTPAYTVNTITIGRNSQTIQGVAEDLVMTNLGEAVELIFDTTNGWVIVDG